MEASSSAPHTAAEIVTENATGSFVDESGPSFSTTVPEPLQQDNNEGASSEPVPLTPEQQAEFDRQVAAAEALKAEGNSLYGHGQHAEALAKYTEALQVRDDSM